MKFLRWLLGRIILFLDAIFSPPGVEREAAKQKKLDQEASELAIYQFEACPFCVKVRRYLKSASLSIPLRDALREPYRTELIQGGGKHQVPCMRIPKSDGSVQWLYESNDIIAYLKERFGTA